MEVFVMETENPGTSYVVKNHSATQSSQAPERKELNLPAYGCTIKSAFSLDVIGDVSPKIVLGIAKIFCEPSFNILKDLPMESEEFTIKLFSKEASPSPDFKAAVYWIHKLSKANVLDKICYDTKLVVGEEENESEFLFRVLMSQYPEFLKAVNTISNQEATVGRKFFLFGQATNGQYFSNPKFKMNLDKIEGLFREHCKARGYGERVRVSEIIKDDVIGLNIERGTTRRSEAKIDISNKVVDRNDRSIKRDVVFFHIPTQCMWASCAPKDVETYVAFLALALFGPDVSFSKQKTFDLSFLKEASLATVLENAKTEKIKKILLRTVNYRESDIGSLTLDFKVKRQRECLCQSKKFQEHRLRYDEPHYVKLQTELFTDKYTVDSIHIYQDGIQFGDHLGEEHSLAVLHKLKVVGAFTND